MIQTKFNYIEEFLNIRQKCCFCNIKLDFIFTNHFGVARPAIPLIKCHIINDEFIFRFKYDSFNLNIDSLIAVNVKTNSICYPGNRFEIVKKLQELSPHVELQCINKKCKMNYYLSSSSFKIYETNIGKYVIEPFRLEWEAFNVSKYWVKNDYPNKTTDIFSTTDDFNHKPIIMPLIDLQSMSGDKIKNKILTVVTFS